MHDKPAPVIEQQARVKLPLSTVAKVLFGYIGQHTQLGAIEVAHNVPGAIPHSIAQAIGARTTRPQHSPEPPANFRRSPDLEHSRSVRRVDDKVVVLTKPPRLKFNQSLVNAFEQFFDLARANPLRRAARQHKHAKRFFASPAHKGVTVNHTAFCVCADAPERHSRALDHLEREAKPAHVAEKLDGVAPKRQQFLIQHAYARCRVRVSFRAAVFLRVNLRRIKQLSDDHKFAVCGYEIAVNELHIKGIA